MNNIQWEYFWTVGWLVVKYALFFTALAFAISFIEALKEMKKRKTFIENMIDRERRKRDEENRKYSWHQN